MTLIAFRHRWLRRGLTLGLVLGPVVLSALPAVGKDEPPPLPEDKIVVDIDAPDEAAFRIGIPNLIGEPEKYTANGGSVLQNDFRLMPGFRVIGPNSVRHDYVREGLGVDLGAWALLGANGVIKGQMFGNDTALVVELRFYQSPLPTR
jgi:TolB amino-terminal domain